MLCDVNALLHGAAEKEQQILKKWTRKRLFE